MKISDVTYNEIKKLLQISMELRDEMGETVTVDVDPLLAMAQLAEVVKTATLEKVISLIDSDNA